MRLERVRAIDWVAGAAGVALLVVLALPWYDLLDGSLSAFQAFSFVDLWLALIALGAIAIPLVTAWCDSPSMPLAVAVTTEVLSWIAVLLALLRAVDDPARGLDATAMPWVGLAVTLLLAIVVWRSIRDERAPSLRPSPAPEAMASPPANAPAEPTAEPT